MSQGSVVLPTSGVVSGATFAADVNAGFDAIRTSWAGGSAPSADTPEEGQHWLDTSVAGAITMKLYTGSAWVAVYTILTGSNTVVTGLSSSLTTVSDATSNMVASDRNIAYTAITAARVVNLVAANSYPAGTELCVYDDSGNCSATNTITVTRAGSDTIDGPFGASSTWQIAQPYGFVRIKSDGTSKWTVVGWSKNERWANVSIGGTHTVAQSDAGATLNLTSTTTTTVTLNSSTGFSSNFDFRLTNKSGRGHVVASTQIGNIWLYPGDDVIITPSSGSTTWVSYPPVITLATVSTTNQYFAGRKPGPLFVTKNTLFVSTGGSDTLNDGLTSTAAFADAVIAINMAFGLVDGMRVPNGYNSGASISLVFSTGRWQAPAGGGYFINGQLTGHHIFNLIGTVGGGGGQTQIVSSGSNPCISLNDCGVLTMTNMEFAGIDPGGGASTNSIGISAARSVVCDVGLGCTFGAFTNGLPIQIGAGDASVALTDQVTIAPGNCLSFVSLTGGLMEFSASTYLGNGIQNNYQNGFINAANSGSRVIVDPGANFAQFLSTGSSDTGNTFVLAMNATLDRGGVQIPGKTAGTSTSGAQFK